MLHGLKRKRSVCGVNEKTRRNGTGCAQNIMVAGAATVTVTVTVSGHFLTARGGSPPFGVREIIGDLSGHMRYSHGFAGVNFRSDGCPMWCNC